ncbi:hypothetical protein G6M14_18040 [Agrobacterium tumefaciens]|uniref:hypothetical protein n=1 Tax=Agrobacterium tumefaciens TaxID=358 RepID=UPI001571C0BC|nr:hypothetical protein [Agrobacterium tumefaciens]
MKHLQEFITQRDQQKTRENSCWSHAQFHAGVFFQKKGSEINKGDTFPASSRLLISLCQKPVGKRFA